MSDELAAMSISRGKPVELVTLTELPEKPTGWTKHLAVHFNYGAKGGAANYTIRDEHGRQTNIGYAYDTRKSKGAPRGEAGFFVNGSELMSWVELRRRYSELTQTKPDAARAIPNMSQDERPKCPKRSDYPGGDEFASACCKWRVLEDAWLARHPEVENDVDIANRLIPNVATVGIARD